mgnify:CR=1 FL=1
MNKSNKLTAPKEYYELSPSERKGLLNQCGPDGPLNNYIPNHLLGTNISRSCDINDFMFIEAKNKKEAELADKVFLKNMNVQIQSEPKSNILNPIRRFFAKIYFYATRAYSSIKK